MEIVSRLVAESLVPEMPVSELKVIEWSCLWVLPRLKVILKIVYGTANLCSGSIG
jgi:hypothetical protein